MLLIRQCEAGGIGPEIGKPIPAGEDQAAVLFPHAFRHQKARVTADGIIHEIAAAVFHTPCNMQQTRILRIKRMPDVQTEGIGIVLPKGGCREKPVRNGEGCLLQTCKNHIAGKAVLGLHGVFPTAHAIFPVRKLSDKGKENRRVPVPDRRIGGPDALAAGGLVQNAAELGAGVIDTKLQGFVFQNVLHGNTSKR